MEAARLAGRYASALALLMLRVLANDHDAAFALDNLALFADGLHARTDLHFDIHSFKTRLIRGSLCPLGGSGWAGERVNSPACTGA